MKRFTIVLSVLFLAGLLAVYFLSRYVGETQPATAFMLYLPQQGWLLPLIVLLPLCLRYARRWALYHLLATLLFLWLHLGFKWSFRPTPLAQEQLLTVLTNNRGEDHKQSSAAFIAAESPDVMVFQDDTRAEVARRAYPGYAVRIHGRYTLVSRYPITDSGFVKLKNPTPSTAATWFEIQYQGAPLAIYNIHLPTPRRALAELRFGGLAAALLGWGNSPLAEKRREEQEGWLARVRLAEELEAVVSAEKRPYLLAGDFNMPAWGSVYRLFQKRHSDAFAAAGHGWGFSFPGDFRNWIGLFGPWLRLDYLFAGPGLKPVYARVETGRASQHQCVVARFQVKP